ncbi:alpha-ribazole phosphatase [Leptospira stimsonii]|uniref:Alpha-ribazole phosphatase n=1 Tax=Leptospira stimsonii TaxID=2202203 RepID=A0ABY2NA55_9LEPT|nr:alpha-ribazole phosphatase [Leptospira stimsonii]TGK11246.1 alpha-ribazole phosphatase [Leptospira stimsonii]TGM19232.1 alpha-ribazole phosphatase [Leptospira stimsonii]
MELFLIRHSTPEVPKGTCYGRTDLPLITDFKIEFEKISAKLNSTLDRIYSSPSRRCKELAEFLSKNSKGTVEYSELLMELDFGSWEGKLWSEIPHAESEYWMKDFVNQKTPNGESYLDLSQRISFFMEEILRTYSTNSKVGIVTHAGPIRAFLCSLASIPLASGFQFDLEYGSVSKVIVDKNETEFFSKVIYWNR